MKTVTTIAELRHALDPLREGSVVGLVPTMGALHAGHVALLETARAECDVVVASIFLNPSQFAEQADLAAYPTDFARDEQIAEAAGVDLVFAPAVAEFYPDGFSTWVEPEGIALILEGEARPGHFRGVATACLKLFTIVKPDLAFFGRKDAQQVAVVKQLVRDFNLELELRVVPTVRDPDGLALSSRNVRLSDAERQRALAIPLALATLDPDRAAEVLAQADIAPDYVAVVDLDGPTLAIAAPIGSTRLLDNILLEGDSL